MLLGCYEEVSDKLNLALKRGKGKWSSILHPLRCIWLKCIHVNSYFENFSFLYVPLLYQISSRYSAIHHHCCMSCRSILFCSVLFFSCPVYEVSSHHERTFSIYFYPIPFWLTLPWWVLSTSWCCPSRLCVVFLACVHLALFYVLSLSPGNSLIFSGCDHTMLASLLWQSLTVPSYRAV